MKYNPESPLYQFLTTLAEFIGLNALFLITCIPIFTIGASLSALYTVTLQESRKEYGYIYSTYLKAFKRNFLSATGAFLSELFFALIFIFNAAFWGAQNTVLGNLFLLIMTGLLVLLSMVFLYSFPLIARFQNSIKQTIKNSIYLALNHPKTTLALLMIHALAVVLLLYVSYMKTFMLILGFSFLAYCCSFLFNKIFAKYEETSC